MPHAAEASGAIDQARQSFPDLALIFDDQDADGVRCRPSGGDPVGGRSQGEPT